MKKLKLYVLIVIAFLGNTVVFGGTISEEFKVYGNCGMCESRIEKAANGVEGVIKADWDKTTKQMVVEFDDSTTNTEVIHKAIAKVGHDTDMVRAEDTVYNDLPGCCQYDRASIENSEHDHHNH